MILTPILIFADANGDSCKYCNLKGLNLWQQIIADGNIGVQLCDNYLPPHFDAFLFKYGILAIRFQSKYKALFLAYGSQFVSLCNLIISTIL